MHQSANDTGGDLNIALDASPCRWSLSYVKWKASDLASVSEVDAKLIAKADLTKDCE